MQNLCVLCYILLDEKISLNEVCSISKLSNLLYPADNKTLCALTLQGVKKQRSSSIYIFPSKPTESSLEIIGVFLNQAQMNKVGCMH